VRLHWIPIVLVGLLLAGCSSDYRLGRVNSGPEQPIEPVDPPGPPGPPGLPGPPTPPNPHWPPQPGNVPDLYFAIAWSETPCHLPDDPLMDGSAPFLGNSEEPSGARDEEPGDALDQQSSDEQFWMSCDARNVAVVNMFGEVVDEFVPPGLDPTTMIEFKELVNAGPGRFLHVFDRYDGELFDTDGDMDGLLVAAPWQAWRGDSYTGENILVASADSDTGRVLLPEAGRHIDVGWSSNQLQLGVLPTDPDWLVTWQGSAWCDPHTTIQPLQLTHMFDGGLLNQGWQPEEFLPEEVRELMEHPMGWNMDLSFTEDGEMSALFGVTTGGCSGLPEEPHTLQLVSWTPTRESSWFAPTETGWLPRSATYAGWHGTGALNLLSATDGTAGARWRVTSPSRVSEGTLSTRLTGYRPGPLLDPQGPTFAVIGSDSETWASDSLDFYHDGQVVWSIDSLQFGLQDRHVYIGDVILLTQLPDEEAG